jgi:hypothetical protein
MESNKDSPKGQRVREIIWFGNPWVVWIIGIELCEVIILCIQHFPDRKRQRQIQFLITGSLHSW